jgi:hypothetical protein
MASVCKIGPIAYQPKRPLAWNPKNNPEANVLLGRAMTEEWDIEL